MYLFFSDPTTFLVVLGVTLESPNFEVYPPMKCRKT